VGQRNIQINRHTYEEFFLLYIDNELSDEERKAVEAFIVHHPDLEEELISLQLTVIEPRDHIVFDHKKSLFKNSGSLNPVNETNCESWFILYSDCELSEDLRVCTRQFVEENPVQTNFLSSTDRLPATQKKEITGNRSVEKQAPGLAASARHRQNTNSKNTVGFDTGKRDKMLQNVSPGIPNLKAKPVALPETNATDLDGAIYKPTVPVSGPPVIADEQLVSNKASEQASSAETIRRNVLIAAVENAGGQAKQDDDTHNKNTIYVANASVNKKNKLRGILRTASRFIEKAASIEPPSKNHGFRVSNAEIALQ